LLQGALEQEGISEWTLTAYGDASSVDSTSGRLSGSPLTILTPGSESNRNVASLLVRSRPFKRDTPNKKRSCRYSKRMVGDRRGHR
jgi:hypothetical protein